MRTDGLILVDERQRKGKDKESLFLRGGSPESRLGPLHSERTTLSELTWLRILRASRRAAVR